MNKPKSPTFIKAIAQNKRAFHDYFIEERYEAGLVLKGWEVKSLRANRVHIAEGYVLIKGGELWILGMHITPLNTVSTHIIPDPTRTRKLLLHKREMDKLYGSIERKGYTLVPLTLYWKGRNVKLEIGLGKGKKEHDKRETIKEREWDRQKARVLRQRI